MYLRCVNATTFKKATKAVFLGVSLKSLKKVALFFSTLNPIWPGDVLLPNYSFGSLDISEYKIVTNTPLLTFRNWVLIFACFCHVCTFYLMFQYRYVNLINAINIL